jgi:chromosome segregation ATPase
MKRKYISTIKTPLDKLNKGEKIEHYNAVLLEDLKSDMKAVIDGMESTKVTLRREMQEFRSEVNQRFDTIEFVVRQHSSDINDLKADVGVLKADVGVLKADVGVLKTDVSNLNSKIGDLGTRIDSVESNLSEKIDKIGERLDDHETRIAALETARP